MVILLGESRVLGNGRRHRPSFLGRASSHQGTSGARIVPIPRRMAILAVNRWLQRSETDLVAEPGPSLRIPDTGRGQPAAQGIRSSRSGVSPYEGSGNGPQSTGLARGLLPKFAWESSNRQRPRSAADGAD